jgi:hypothetical protein
MIQRLAQTSLLGALLIGSAHASDYEGVVLYEHANYGGDSLALYPGEGIPNLQDFWKGFFDSWNDDVGSVAVWGPVTVYLYEHANYQGDVIVLNDHTDALYEWNDEASSVWVEYTPFTGWVEDTSLDSWVYWEADGWIWHEQGLGWIYGGDYEPSVGGWLWDISLGWVYTNASIYPWLIGPSGEAYYSYTENSQERWFYDDTYGWNIR